MAATVTLTTATLLCVPLATYLELDPDAVRRGEWWRLLSGHLTHFSTDHLLWCVLAFFGLGVAAERFGRTRTLACIYASAIAISIATLYALPDLSAYRGLSGITSALFGLLAVTIGRDAFQHPDGPQWWRLAVIATIIVGFVV